MPMKNSIEYYALNWRREQYSALKEEFTESRIIRLTSVKPAKLIDLSQAEKILLDLQKLRFFACVPHGIRHDGKRLPPTVKSKGWNPGWDVYITTSAKIAKLDLLIEDLEERVEQLEAEVKQAGEAQKRSEEAAKQFIQTGIDEKLAGALWHALETVSPSVGYIYFKRWAMPDGSCWFKVGITNNPSRRETEQNVLPVAAETIACVDVGSMDRARTIEAVFHQVLDELRITNANNRELFHLSDTQASAVKAIFEKLA